MILTERIRFEKTTMSDIAAVSEWHKEESVRKWIFVNDWTEFYKAVGTLPGYYLYSAYIGNDMAAHIAGERYGDELAMDLIVDPALHGRGIGSEILKEMTAKASELFGDIAGFAAHIFPGNTASKRCFEKAGFVFSGEGEDGEMIYRYSLDTDAASRDGD